MSIPVLTPEFSENLHLNAPLPQPIASMIFESESKILVFDDGSTIYGYSTRCRRVFAIASRAQLNGWSFDGANLFVQDGPVLCLYDMMALDSHAAAWPVKAINLETKQQWSSDQPRDGFTALFPSPASTSKFGAPVVWSRDPSGVIVNVLVVSDMTRILRLPANLDPHPWESWSTQLVPDAPLEMFAFDAPDGPFLQFLSGGQVTTIRMHPMQQLNQQAPAESAEHWRRLGRASITGRPQQSIPVPAGRGGEDLWACNCTGLQVYAAPNYEGAKARIAVATGPDASIAGDLGTDSDPRTLRSLPVFSQEHNEHFVYVLATDSQGTARLEKYKLEIQSGGSAGHARALIDSQLRGIAPWLLAGAKGTPAWTQATPFDANSSVVCAAAMLEALGAWDGAIAQRLPGAGANAAARMMAVARQSGADFPVASAIYRLCGVPLPTLLAGGTYDPTQVATFFRSQGLDVYQVLAYLAPPSVNSGDWWAAGSARPHPVSDQGVSVAGALRAAGYSDVDVSRSLTSSDTNLLHAAVAILKAVYGYNYDVTTFVLIATSRSKGWVGPGFRSYLDPALCTFYAKDCY
jgi:hypothetical protein